jgi:hypothetical protein
MKTCKSCKKAFPPKHTEQEKCWDCDHTEGFKLCDGPGCFEVFVPSRAQRIAMHKYQRLMWICTKCSSP